jgi:hypothetical protein
MAKTLDVVLHSDFPPQTCLAKLAGDIDIDQFTLFSLSGYKGRKAILGRIEGNEFRLHKRRYWHNSFGPVLFGRVQSDGRGALVEGYWGVWPGTRFFMRVWLIFVTAIGTPLFVGALLRAIRSGFAGMGDDWIGLVVPPGLALWGVLLPRIGAALSYSERGYVGEFLERTLVSGPSASVSLAANWKSTFDRL